MEKELLPIRQQALEFARDTRWQQLREPVQRECQQFLSRLLKEVLASERDNDERENQ